jgi:hypothetical protein
LVLHGAGRQLSAPKVGTDGQEEQKFFVAKKADHELDLFCCGNQSRSSNSRNNWFNFFVKKTQNKTAMQEIRGRAQARPLLLQLLCKTKKKKENRNFTMKNFSFSRC